MHSTIISWPESLLTNSAGGTLPDGWKLEPAISNRSCRESMSSSGVARVLNAKAFLLSARVHLINPHSALEDRDLRTPLQSLTGDADELFVKAGSRSHFADLNLE